MTTSATVRAVWKTAIFSGSNAIEPVIYQQMPSSQLIDADVNELYYLGRLNFIQCLVTSSDQIEIAGNVAQKVYVGISYWIERRVNDESFLVVIDRLEAIRALVGLNLGISWGGTIDYYQPQDSPPDIVDLQVAGRMLWRGRENYLGYKLTSDY